MCPLIKLAALYLVVLVALLLVAGLATGCTRMLELERTIWTPPTASEQDIEQGKTPPLLEVIAGGLATIGFAGMALWIRRNKKHACTKDDVDLIVKNNNAPA